MAHANLVSRPNCSVDAQLDLPLASRLGVAIEAARDIDARDRDLDRAVSHARYTCGCSNVRVGSYLPQLEGHDLADELGM